MTIRESVDVHMMLETNILVSMKDDVFEEFKMEFFQAREKVQQLILCLDTVSCRTHDSRRHTRENNVRTHTQQRLSTQLST